MMVANRSQLSVLPSDLPVSVNYSLLEIQFVRYFVSLVTKPGEVEEVRISLLHFSGGVHEIRPSLPQVKVVFSFLRSSFP